MSYQSLEFHKFFWAINCCSYITNGFHKIFTFSRFAFSLHFFSRKSLRNATENFCIFSRNVSFAGNPSPDHTLQLSNPCILWCKTSYILSNIIHIKGLQHQVAKKVEFNYLSAVISSNFLNRGLTLKTLLVWKLKFLSAIKKRHFY